MRAENEEDAERSQLIGEVSGGRKAEFGASRSDYMIGGADSDRPKLNDRCLVGIGATIGRSCLEKAGGSANAIARAGTGRPGTQRFPVNDSLAADVKTDGSGAATVKVKYPDSLTTWLATARVATSGNQFGIGNATTRTKQPLIVRLQAPRFFVVGDQVTVSAVINNNTELMHVATSWRPKA